MHPDLYAESAAMDAEEKNVGTISVGQCRIGHNVEVEPSLLDTTLRLFNSRWCSPHRRTTKTWKQTLFECVEVAQNLIEKCKKVSDCS